MFEIKAIDNHHLHPEHQCPSHEGVNSRITLGCWFPRKKCCFVKRNIISVFNFFARKRNPLIIICSHRPRRTSRGIDVLKTFDNYNLHPEHQCPSHEGVNSRITLGCWHPRKNKQPVKACDHTEVEGSFSYCRKTSPLLPFSALSFHRGG